MFESSILANHLTTSDTIKVDSFVIVEWNMNDPENIKQLGNYRYRPTDSSSPYFLIPSNFIDIETGPIYYWTGATDSDTVIESGLNTQDEPTVFLSPKTKMKLLYSLEDCIKPFRPRSGINKVLYLGTLGQQPGTGQYIDDPRKEAARRPRYYMASKDDQFKYWTSYRTEYGIPTPIPGNPEQSEEREVVRGISFSFSPDGPYYIEDTAPFVVYQESVPTNKIVIKVQTNVGEVSLGNFRYGTTSGVADPLFGDVNKTTPQRWRIEGLKNGSWSTLATFDENSTKPDGSPLFGPDGYLEISYGLRIPQIYENIFSYVGEFPDATLLPDSAIVGDSYLVKQDNEDIGTFYIYNGSGWDSFIPEYGWTTSSEEFSKNSNYVTKFSDPEYYFSGTDKVYREFEFIDGIRIVVNTMNRANCTFDLIEMSPRLVGNITDFVSNVSITKPMSDLGNSSLPVGNLLAATGKLDIFDDTMAFNETNVFDEETNTGSIVYKYLDKITKFIIYNNVKEVRYENATLDYFIPQKTMYAYGFPQTVSPGNALSLELRDFFFFLESSKAPQLFLTNVSLSYIVMLLLDYIGFDNYVFRRTENDEELIIPYFFVEPGQNVAEILQKLATASQSAMFFDEYNNFVVMSKEYLLPNSEQTRTTDLMLLGQETVYDQNNNSYYLIDEVYDVSEMQSELDGAYINLSNDSIYIWSDGSWQNIGPVDKIERPNIVEFSTKENKFYNSGQINYTVRYLQRSIGSTNAALKIDEYKNYIYKPVLLWEAPGNQNRQTINELGGQSSGYVLGAIPLNSDLTENLPYALNNSVYNNIIDVGENIYWLVDFQGYFYANGEIIRYDAVEYSVSGQISPVWIKNNQEYQDYFGNLPFNGKMYPTGRIRIYTNPEFETTEGSNELRLKDANPIPIHGRGQFGTAVTSHPAGFNNDTYWTNDENVYGIIQDASSYLFNINEYVNYPPNLTNSESGKQKTIGTTFISSDTYANQSGRNGIIKNFLTDKYFTEKEVSYKKTTEPGTVQSSALVFTGPEIPQQVEPSNFVSYIYKDFINEDGTSTPYRHYGTRMRIIGTIDAATNKIQSPVNSFPIFSGGTSLDPNNSSIPSISANTDSAESIIRGGTGGIAINVDKNKNTGYFLEIVALSVDDPSLYSDNNSNSINAEIISSPAPSANNGTVTVYTKNQAPFEVGQTVIVYGLVDVANPQNTSTPLNGEYTVQSISSDKKSFTYTIPSSSLTTTSQTGGSAIASSPSATNLANVFFYKTLSCDKANKIAAYQRQSNVLTLNMLNQNYFQAGEKINITLSPIEGEYTVLSSENHIITVASSGSDISLTIPTYSESSPDNIVLSEPVNIPYKLWSGLTSINVDSGEFYGQSRLLAEQNSTVYDLAAEYVNIGSTRRFYIYLNGKQLTFVDDETPLPEINSFALFTRGTSKCMFENVYALARNYSQNTVAPVQSGIAQIFGDSEIDATEALRKYALSGIVQKTYLSGINSLEEPNYSMYFEEFGTILRQAAYFNVLYDRAYPALSANLMKTTNRIKGYATSGFYAWSYGAEFLIFNCTDFAITLDDTSGNFLKILGVAFTQNTSYSMTIDDLYKKRSNLLDTSLNKSPVLRSSTFIDQEYNRIKNSIDKYGRNEFTIESPYIQSTDAAENVFGWVVDKVCKPRKMIGARLFGVENIQLGDIVKIKYINSDNINIISNPDMRFTVYHIEYVKDENGPSTTVFLAEV